ncbi:hypothetical protein LCGC14_2736610, partial [marine sediment metagenome]
MSRPRKRDTEEKHLTRLVTELIKDNPNLSDIGTIVGCLGEGSVKELEELKKNSGSIDEFLEVARQRADIALVVAAIKAAIGYDYIEEEQEIRRIPRTGADGCIEIVETPGNKKIRKKHAKKSDALLKFLLMNRLPQYFSDVRKVEINKKVIEIKSNTEAEIRTFAGKLLSVIDSEFIKTDNKGTS